MAEFCSECAQEWGMKADAPPLLCEGCGEYIERKSIWKMLKEWLGLQ